ncbi:MAG: hypothetical protein ACN6P5_19870 [Pseudomonas protegens]|uniref:MrpH family fimbial adhesin n=1 Tax=Pseudomonas protegens TaxID=380021 RepID=UPI003839FDDA
MCTNTAMTHCGVMIVGARGPGAIGYWIDTPYYYSNMKTSSSPANILAQMKDKGFSMPFHGSFVVPTGTPVSSTLCISFAYAETAANIGGAFNLYGPCARVVKPTLQCDIGGNTMINHGSVNDMAIDGNEAGATLRVSCTGVSSVIVSASKESASGIKLRTDGSLYSKLTIDGKSAADGVSIKVEEGFSTPIFVKSTLFSKGAVEPGKFSGSTVLTISPP